MPIRTAFHNGATVHVTSALITTLLRTSAAAMPGLGFSPQDVTARSLRAGGAMALLCTGVDTDTIKLVWRWRSDVMFRYLHAQALPLVRHLALSMLQGGSFVLLPGANEPAGVQAVLQQHPYDPHAAVA